MTTFGKAELVNGRLVVTEQREIAQSDLRKCPFVILVPDHYREDGSCKCDDRAERAKMIAEWGYSDVDFNGIPLRKGE
jgi:hypothetical protein